MQISLENKVSFKNFVKSGIIKTLASIFRKGQLKKDADTFEELTFVLQDMIFLEDSLKTQVGEKFLTALVSVVEDKSLSVHMRLNAASTLNLIVAHSKENTNLFFKSYNSHKLAEFFPHIVEAESMSLQNLTLTNHSQKRKPQHTTCNLSCSRSFTGWPKE